MKILAPVDMWMITTRPPFSQSSSHEQPGWAYRGQVRLTTRCPTGVPTGSWASPTHPLAHISRTIQDPPREDIILSSTHLCVQVQIHVACPSTDHCVPNAIAVPLENHSTDPCPLGDDRLCVSYNGSAGSSSALGYLTVDLGSGRAWTRTYR